MARMHAKTRGKSSSNRPYLTSNPDWVPLEKEEIEETIVRLAGEGLSTAEIGTRLRDQYGVPNVKLATGKSVTTILKEKGFKFDLPEDLENLMRKAVIMNAHLTEHRKDKHNRRGLQLVESKIRRLVKYYKKKGVLPEDWRYSVETAQLLIK